MTPMIGAEPEIIREKGKLRPQHLHLELSEEYE